MVVPYQVLLLSGYQIICTLLCWSKMRCTKWIALMGAKVDQRTFGVELLILLCVGRILKWLCEWSIKMWLKIIKWFWCLWDVGVIHVLFSSIFWFHVMVHLCLVYLFDNIPFLDFCHFSCRIFIGLFWCHIFKLLILYFRSSKKSDILFFKFSFFIMIIGVLNRHKKAIWSLHSRINLLWKLQCGTILVETLNLVLIIGLNSKNLAFVWSWQVFCFHTWILLLANCIAVKSVWPESLFHWWATSTFWL